MRLFCVLSYDCNSLIYSYESIIRIGRTAIVHARDLCERNNVERWNVVKMYDVCYERCAVSITSRLTHVAA